MKKKIAIIGAGLGGLTAGNLLAARGHDVTVFESHSTPGGYTAGFRRRGYYFESGTLSFEMSRDVFGLMERLGVLHQLKFVRQHGRFLGGRFDYTSESYEGFKAAMSAAFPEHRPALDGYFRELDVLYVTMKTLMVGSGKSFPLSALGTAGAAARMARIWRPRGRAASCCRRWPPCGGWTTGVVATGNATGGSRTRSRRRWSGAPRP